MNTQMATRQIRLNKWAEVIEDRNRSGMTIEAYCETSGIARNTYYYWLRKVKEAVLEAEAGFVELTPMPSAAPALRTASAESTIHIRVGRALVEVNKGTSPELLQMVLGVLTRAE